MSDRRISKDIQYGELITGKRSLGRLQLRYHDVCKRDMEELIIELNRWKELATDRSKWRSYLKTTLKVGEKKYLP